MDLYKTAKFVGDSVVRAEDIHPLERFDDVVAEYIKTDIKKLLSDAFRLHQPKARVDVKIKGNDTQLVFASGNDPVGQLKLVPFSKYVNVAVEGKVKNIVVVSKLRSLVRRV